MKYTVLGRIVVLLFSVAAFAEQPQSGNLRLTRHVLTGGGASSGAGSLRVSSVTCLSTPVGVSSNSQFSLYAGYMVPAFQVAPLSPIRNLVITRLPATNNMHLSWAAVPVAGYYVIYRDSNPGFVPGPASRIGTSSTNAFTDVNAVTLPTRTYFYVVTWVRSQNP
jgi:hypothetical protein